MQLFLLFVLIQFLFCYVMFVYCVPFLSKLPYKSCALIIFVKRESMPMVLSLRKFHLKFFSYCCCLYFESSTCFLFLVSIFILWHTLSWMPFLAIKGSTLTSFCFFFRYSKASTSLLIGFELYLLSWYQRFFQLNHNFLSGSDEKYQQFQADGNLQYKCAACRGDCYQV